MGRASYAASRIFLTRDNSREDEAEYFVLARAANFDRWCYRSPSILGAIHFGASNNFGSTIGSDAGINIFHKFGPGIRQMVKGHTPKFVSRIAESITFGPTKDAAPIPAR
jgi:hypothetical protein